MAKISSFSDNYDIVLLPILFVFECFNIWSMIYSMKSELHSLKSLENGVLHSVYCVLVFLNIFVVISDSCHTVHLFCCTKKPKTHSPTCQLAKSWQSGRPLMSSTPGDSVSESSLTGFFDSASVNRFSICFNHGADGVLGINTPSHLESDMGLYKIV